MALQVCQITPVSQAHGSSLETPCHPAKSSDFAEADGGTFTFGTGVPDSEN